MGRCQMPLSPLPGALWSDPPLSAPLGVLVGATHLPCFPQALGLSLPGADPALAFPAGLSTPGLRPEPPHRPFLARTGHRSLSPTTAFSATPERPSPCPGGRGAPPAGTYRPFRALWMLPVGLWLCHALCARRRLCTPDALRPSPREALCSAPHAGSSSSGPIGRVPARSAHLDGVRMRETLRAPGVQGELRATRPPNLCSSSPLAPSTARLATECGGFPAPSNWVSSTFTHV